MELTIGSLSASLATYIGVGIPDDWRERSAPEEEWQTVEIPDVELVVERTGKHHPHQVGGEQYQQHVCSQMMRFHNKIILQDANSRQISWLHR